MIDFASALEEAAANSVLFTPFPRVQIDFAREIFTEWAGETGVELTNIYSLKKFLENLHLVLIEKIRSSNN